MAQEAQQAAAHLVADQPVVDRNAMRQSLLLHAKNVTSCDGRDQKSLRTWLEDVTGAKLWGRLDDVTTLELVGIRSTGPLRKTIEDFVRQHQLVTWEQVSTLVQDQFLEEDDAQASLHRLRRIHQTAYQSVLEYGLEFQDCVRRAYRAVGPDTPYLQPQLIEAYISGLGSERVQLAVLEDEPATLVAAVESGNKAAKAKRRLEDIRQGQGGMARREEAMEIGAISTQGPSRAQAAQEREAELHRIVTGLQRQVNKLSTRLGELDVKPKNAAPSGGGKKKYGHLQFTEDDKPICYRCKTPGHIGRNCPNRQQEN